MNTRAKLTAFTPFVPGKEPPPMEQRPVCPGCGVRLRPWIDGGYEEPRQWSGDYDAYGAFCRLRCAADYANKEFKRTGMRYSAER